MKGKQLKWFEHELDSKRAALEYELRLEFRERERISSAQMSGEAVEFIGGSTRREIVSYELVSKSRLLGKVREALGRIAVGAYGTCVYCSEEIARERLMAMPWTRTCIGCQEHLERNGLEVFDESASHAF